MCMFSPTFFPPQGLSVYKAAVPSQMAGWRSTWEDCGGPSAAMIGGMKMLRWLVDSWGRGEILELCGYDSGAQHIPHLQYTFIAQSSLQRCDRGCDDILVGDFQIMLQTYTFISFTVFVFFLFDPCIPTPHYPRGIEIP